MHNTETKPFLIEIQIIIEKNPLEQKKKIN